MSLRSLLCITDIGRIHRSSVSGLKYFLKSEVQYFKYQKAAGSLFIRYLILCDNMIIKGVVVCAKTSFNLFTRYDDVTLLRQQRRDASVLL